VTKTVDGMCADCWGVKDAARAKRWQRTAPRTRQLLGGGLLSAENLLWVVGFAIGFILLLVWGLTAWT
jgi:protein-disulfide isomerase-like protein with CxxC motif